MKYNKMLKIWLFLAWLTLPLLSFGDSRADRVFAQANTLYTKAQYRDALNMYNKLIEQGYQSAALYFNAGNASYKSGDMASAILYYEKAHKLSPGDEDINFNLKYANLKTVDKVEIAPVFFLNQWWKVLILKFALRTLSVWSIIFVLTGSAALIIYFFAQATVLKKGAFYMAISLFFVGLFTIFVAGSQASYFDDHHQAIIFTSVVNVKNGPVEQSGTLFVLHDGTKVDILDYSNGWVKIKLANGNEGWIKQSDVKEI